MLGILKVLEILKMLDQRISRYLIANAGDFQDDKGILRCLRFSRCWRFSNMPRFSIPGILEMLEMHKKQVILKIVKILNSIGSREARDDKKQAILKIVKILNSRESGDAKDAQEASYSQNCIDSQF
jgi:hypothetical protein